MRKMLEELFYANISPNEKRFLGNTDFERAMQTLSEKNDKLDDLLDGKEKKLFLDLVNAQSYVNGIISVEGFINSFRLGAKWHLKLRMVSTSVCVKKNYTQRVDVYFNFAGKL